MNGPSRAAASAATAPRPRSPMSMAPGCGWWPTWPIPTATLAIIATGQSGNPASGHWGDLLPLWRDGAG